MDFSFYLSCSDCFPSTDDNLVVFLPAIPQELLALAGCRVSSQTLLADHGYLQAPAIETFFIIDHALLTAEAFYLSIGAADMEHKDIIAGPLEHSGIKSLPLNVDRGAIREDLIQGDRIGNHP